MSNYVEYSAICTWGDGPDVSLRIDPTDPVFKTVWYDLTSDQAIKLASELLTAAYNAKALDTAAELYFEKEELMERMIEKL